jgi:hypothetical protein
MIAKARRFTFFLIYSSASHVHANFSLESVDTWANSLETLPPAESTVRGYKVKINRQLLSYDDLANRRSAVAKIAAQSLSSSPNK